MGNGSRRNHCGPLVRTRIIKKIDHHRSQANEVFIPVPVPSKAIITSMMAYYPKHFVVLDIMSVTPSFQGYPAYTQHYVRINMVNYGKPKVYQWDYQSFSHNHVDIPTEERLERWRAYALGVTPKKFTTNHIIGEQPNLRIFTAVNSRSYRSPLQGTLITEP